MVLATGRKIRAMIHIGLRPLRTTSTMQNTCTAMIARYTIMSGRVTFGGASCVRGQNIAAATAPVTPGSANPFEDDECNRNQADGCTQQEDGRVADLLDSFADRGPAERPDEECERGKQRILDGAKFPRRDRREIGHERRAGEAGGDV